MPDHKLKLATTKDIPDIVELHKGFHGESPYAAYQRDETRIVDLAVNLLNSQESLILLAEVDGKNVGVLAITVTPAVFSWEKQATELIWYILPKYRNYKIASDMMAAYEYWCHKKKVKYMSLVCVDDGVQKFYRRKGYARKETAFMKEI